MSIYSEYVNREGIGSAADAQALLQESKDRGWNEYYVAHGTFLNTVWDAIGSAGQNVFLNVLNDNAIKTVYVTTEFGGGSVTEPVEVINTDSGWGYWLARTIYDLPGGEEAINNWNTLSKAKKESFILHSAKRRMAFDWHNGIGGYGTPGGPGYPPGKDRGLATYSVANTGVAGGGSKKNVVILDANSNSYLNDKVKEDFYSAWGYGHWENNGKNEARALPGQKFYVDGNGKLTYDDTNVGTGLRDNYANIAKSFNDSEGGNYKGLVEGAVNGLPSSYWEDFTGGNINDPSKGDFTAFSGYYLANKVTALDKNTLLNPPVGGFNETYYAETDHGKDAKKLWDEGQTALYGALPDWDVVGPYGNIGNYYHDYYSKLKRSGVPDSDNRGNDIEKTSYSDYYKETFNINFTDAERQNIRDNQLGLTGTRISDGEKIRTVDWEDENYGALEKIIGQEILQQEFTEQDKFKGLGLDVLQKTIDDLNAAKARERELDVYKGLPGFSEIFSINSSITNSIIGDSGIGGLLGMMGKNTSELQEKFEEGLGEVTGVDFGNVSYNWQKWYDDTLVKELNEQSSVKGFGVSFNEETGEVTIGDERTTVYELEEDFKKNFIDNYIAPRFEQSKSMDEFISYIDTIDRETEQNIFQTQTSINALRDVAALRAEAFYADLESGANSDVKYFDPDFYADPTDVEKYGSVNEEKALRYQEQKEGFEKDWAAAKADSNAVAYSLTKEEAEDFGLTGGQTSVTWGQLAYYYGVDLEDENSFAKLHYENIGRGRGYDPARDVVTQSDINEFVENNVLTAVKDADASFGDSPFLAFVTPEEFADSILEGIDPIENKEEWKKILEMYGLDETTSSLEEVREIILETVRTGEATVIREGIKYLNQKKLKPTQERLGVSYIERDEDDIDLDDPDADALFKTFQSAGYAGTQEEFYETFMPDADRGDIQLITQGMSGLTLNIGDMSDPFEALGSLSSFLGDGDGTDIFGMETKEEKKEESNYFDLFADEKEEDYASPTGRGFIDDFTSFFK